MGCSTTRSTISEALPTGETPARTTATFCVSRRPPKQAKHRETCCRTQTQPWFFELKLLVAAVAHFADVATAMGVVVIRPKMDMEFVVTCLYHCF